MNKSQTSDRKWNERSSASKGLLGQSEPMFESLFERSADAIWLFDPAAGVFVDCNQAAVELMRAGTKQRLLQARPEDLSPALQPGGMTSREKTAEVIELSAKHGGYRFEWVARRFDGQEVPLEVLSTPIPREGGNLYVIVSRDITERKQAEREVRDLNQTLERRIAERTAELANSEARLRALVDHAPEAIVVIDANTGYFLFGNQHACRLYGVRPEELTLLRPEDVSPEFQACGRPSAELAREKMSEATAGGMPVFEWLHRHADGRLIPTEVRLLRLPSECRPLLRASIIDRTEEKKREQINQAVSEIAEAVHTAEDLEGFYRHVHRVISGLMPAQNFYIALLDEMTQMISFAYHVDERSARPAPRAMDTGLTSVVLRAAKPLLVGGEMAKHKKSVGSGVTFEGLEGISYVECGEPAAIWLGVPLLLKGKAIGVVAVQDYRNERAYGDQEKRILTFVAGQIALALERKRVAEALRESEQKFRALFETSSQGVMLHDETQYLQVNPAAVRILGYSTQEELLGKHPRDTSPPLQPNGESSASLAQQHIEECLTKGSARFEWTGRTAQGRDIPLEVNLTRVEWNGRQIIQAHVTDISERKLAEAVLRESEARLRESEARFSAAFQASPLFTTISRMSDGKYVSVNEAFLQRTGYRLEEVLGRTSAELNLWADPAERELFWTELRAKRSIRDRECLVRNRRGGVATMLLCVDIVEINNVPHVLTVGLDVTDRKQAEVELLKTLAREKELGQLKSNFVSLVSHEFRTPLAIIQSSAEILRDYFEKLERGERAEQLESIVSNTRRMASMMEDVLVLSRLDAGKMNFKPALLDLGVFARRIVGEILSATEQRCVIDLSLPEGALECVADEGLLAHIFTNLLSNAVKYSEPGKQVEFSLRREAKELVSVITDQGIGIPASDQGSVFRAFHRGANVGQRPGSGLGLMLVKRCVDLHGGQVKIQSEVGKGTQVTVKLPVFIA